MTLKYSLLALGFAFTGMVATQAISAEPLIKSAGVAPSSTKTAFSSREGVTASIGSRASDLADMLVFTSPPRETREEGQKIYGPIAEYLSKAVGKKVVYRHPGTWGAYRSEMLKGNYDIVFDGPHFNSYRAEKLSHNVLAKLPGRHEFVIIVNKNEKFTTVSQMGGRTFCTQAPPNLGALILLSQFDNPVRQPSVLPTEGWDKIYEGVVSGRCTGGILPMAILKKLDKNEAVKVVHKTAAMPNQAFSASPRLSLEEQAKVAAALTAPEAEGPTEKLRTAFKVNEKLLAANNAEYSGIAEYLRSEWGYY